VSGLKYGVNTVAVEAVISEVCSWTEEEAEIASDAWEALPYEAWNVAHNAARGAVWSATEDAVLDAVLDSARSAAWDAGREAALEAASDAAVCAVVSDLIPEEYQKLLNVGVEAVREFRGLDAGVWRGVE
jgi:hypothetical protein